MAKTVTLRLDEGVYREFHLLADEEHRSLANWLVTTTLKHLEECQFADELEMRSIRSDRSLMRRLRAGSRDARLKRGRLVG